VFKFKTAQNSKNLRLNGHTRFEFQTKNYIKLNYIFVYGLLAVRMVADVTETRNVILVLNSKLV